MMNIVVVIGFLALAVGAMSQANGQSADDRFALVRARALGMSVYGELCASCHGRSGHGDGPRIQELTGKPTDLTRLAQRNGWTFPAESVARVIDGSDRAHQTSEMPRWGDVFRGDQALADEAAVTERVNALTLYLEFIQLRQYRR
jgi:mono/diheme cytochrome c family protein